MPLAVTVHPIDPDFDRWDDLLALIREAFAFMEGVVDPPSSAQQLTVEGLRDKALAETGLVVFDGPRIIGCAFLAERQDHVYLGKLAVAKDYQGQGIGRALVRHAEGLAVRAGKPAIVLQTRIELTGNHAAFGRLGFIKTAETAHPGYDRPTSITMRKTLAAGAGPTG
ncbi:GNAT family N-acetyltransferase [Phreatobacter stygius]|uniref:GNAT family N-acetyltransferase n=1 Tax=Phreatobacter stygius TaxID=1940610 RepID=A0A4D7AWW6_9HYPH|nr:GNAT family N-acetyltransferase [Phreatobacter stygius]QCI63338.1 GNAT family N-acetyltransferase [Phreatobacter stygius]